MIYDDFHSFMFYFLCLLLTHLILFHIFSVVTAGGKIAFPPLSLFSRLATFLHLHKEINIWEEFCDEKKIQPAKHQNYFYRETHFEELRGIYIWSRKFLLKSCNFPQPSIILSQKMNEWNSSLCSRLETKYTFTRTWNNQFYFLLFPWKTFRIKKRIYFWN